MRSTARSSFPRTAPAQDWGVTFEEFEPYYDQFEHIYGVGGKAGNLNGEIQPGGNPSQKDRARASIPNPPSSHDNLTGTLFAEAAKSMGYNRSRTYGESNAPTPIPTA